MIFKIFVKRLSDRLLHIAKHEAEQKNYSLKRLIQVDDFSILSIRCSNEYYLPKLVDTLETHRRTKVVAVKGTNNRYIDFRNIAADTEYLLFDPDQLELCSK